MSQFIVNFYIYSAFFSSFISEIDIVIDNIMKKGRSEVLINYGNNSELSRILINHVLGKIKEKENDKIEIKTINFNAYINEKEEDVLSQICTFFDLETKKYDFESTCKTIENYFKYLEMDDNIEMDLETIDPLTLKNCNKKKKNSFKTIYVIFYENIDFLFLKQKQILFYTLLEIVNNSKNVIFCGTTNHYNLTSLMEKRIRSRFSQKTFFLDLINKKDLYDTLHCMISPEENNEKMQFFLEILWRNKNFNLYLIKVYDIGITIRELFFNFKVFFSNIMRFIEKESNDIVKTEEIEQFIDRFSRDLIPLSISSLEYLYSKFYIIIGLPKIYIIVIACVIKEISRHKEKIYLGLIYDEYIRLTRKGNLTAIKIDLFKKIIEELNTLGIIYAKRDDKYTFVYELKYSLMELKAAVLKQENYNNFESSLKLFLNDVINQI